jgi:signal peptidase I
MSPLFKEGDWLIVNFNAYRRNLPQRGDVVIVLDPRCKSRHSLKRVTGLPYEQVRLYEGMLWINGNAIRETYLQGRPSTLGLDEYAWNVEQGHLFVMGDNRTRSTDSRTYGSVSTELLVGKAVARIWPIRRAGWLKHGA